MWYWFLFFCGLNQGILSLVRFPLNEAAARTKQGKHFKSCCGKNQHWPTAESAWGVWLDMPLDWLKLLYRVKWQISQLHDTTHQQHLEPYYCQVDYT